MFSRLLAVKSYNKPPLARPGGIMKSHQLSLLPIIETLLERNHEVGRAAQEVFFAARKDPGERTKVVHVGTHQKSQA